MGLFQEGVVEAHTPGQEAAGLAKLRVAVALTEGKLKSQNLYTLLTKSQLGLTELAVGRPAEAEATLLACFDTARQMRLLTHPKAVVLVHTLGELLIARKQPDRAREVVAEWLAAHERQNAESLPHADALTAAARVADRLGDRDEERRRLEAAAAIYRRQPPGFKRRWYVLNLEAQGLSHARAKRWADSEAAYRDCLVKLKAGYGDQADPDEQALAAAGVARAAFRQGRYPEDVGRELTEALARDPDGRGWVQATARLAEYRRHHGQPDQAVNLLREAADRARNADDLVDSAEQLAVSAAAADPAARTGLYDLAANLLARAAVAGYRDADAVTGFAAFRPLAEHRDFKVAIEQMRAKR
jgi:tetratricopeptide (TPR) repeat protein